MKRHTSARLALLASACLALAACAQKPAAPSAEDQIARGKYLVAIMGCGDCHTPGGFSPKPDETRLLAGSDAKFEMAGMGTFVPPNLTPDKETGIGNWTNDQIVTAFTTGVLPDGRVLAPAMPWADFANLTKDDARAIAAYLKSIPAVKNKVPGPAAAAPSGPDGIENIVKRGP
jgi:mono/diheme cytochrome c family protein